MKRYEISAIVVIDADDSDDAYAKADELLALAGNTNIGLMLLEEHRVSEVTE